MAAKGLMFLDSKSAILHEQLHPRILEGKREQCEITFSEFDDVGFKITCNSETPNIVKINMSIRDAINLKKNGSADMMSQYFSGMETAPDSGYDVAIEFDCENLSNPEATLEAVSNIKRHFIGGPMDRAFSALARKKGEVTDAVAINYRKNETMFICPSASKVTVVFLVDFEIVTDKALARVFLQEFVEAQRTVRTAPPVSYSREPPREVAGLISSYNPDAAGFISFALEERHVSGSRKDIAITMLAGFRTYLHYHIKCSKTYLHMRMRKRVAGWLQVLNRAVPELETEKKVASGKTFTRK